MKSKKEHPIILVNITGNTTYQGYINTFIEDNYDELFIAAQKACKNTVYVPEDLLAELVLFLHSKEKKIKSLRKISKNKGLLNWCCKWLYDAIRTYTNERKSSFRKRYKVKESETTHLSNEVLEINTDDIEEVIRDLEKKEAKENLFNLVLKSLTETEKVLLDIYYKQGLSVPKIKERIPQLGKYPLYKMVRELNEKIKNEYEKKLKEIENE